MGRDTKKGYHFVIAYIQGKVAAKSETMVVLDVGGIGYQLWVTQKSAQQLAVGTKIQLYTFLHVKEDGFTLYGFLLEQEQKLFQQLINVSGVGPKTALNFFQAFTVQQILTAIFSEDVALLSKVQGIGKKTAQRVVLDIKDKLSAMDYFVEEDPKKEYHSLETNSKKEGIEALITLGFSQKEATAAVEAVYQPDMDAEQILKLALKVR